MRAVPFRSVLGLVAKKVNGTADNLGVQEAEALALGINEHVRECWERDAWPEWSPVEERFYRDAWTAAAYAAGAEVYHAGTDAYYRASGAVLFSDVPGVAAAWMAESALGDFRRYVALDQTGQTAIGTVLGAYRSDPRLRAGAKRVDYLVTSEGIQLLRHTPTSVWLHFRQRPPEFTATEYDATLAYTAGELVLFATDGECYEALDTVTTPARATVTNGATFNLDSVDGIYDASGEMAAGLPVYVRQDGTYEIRPVGGGRWHLQPVGGGGDFWFGGTDTTPDSAGLGIYQQSGSSTSGNPHVVSTAAVIQGPAIGDTPATDPTKWRKIQFPYVLKHAVADFVYADQLEEDGQTDRASKRREKAEETLATEWSKSETQQGVVRTFRVLNRESTVGSSTVFSTCVVQ